MTRLSLLNQVSQPRQGMGHPRQYTKLSTTWHPLEGRAWEVDRVGIHFHDLGGSFQPGARRLRDPKVDAVGTIRAGHCAIWRRVLEVVAIVGGPFEWVTSSPGVPQMQTSFGSSAGSFGFPAGGR